MPEARFQMLPFGDVPDYAKPIIFAVGLAAINWGKMEQHLEMLLHHVNRDDFITGQLDRFPETSFRIKSQTFEKWYARHPSFAVVHPIAVPVIEGLKKANTSRVRLFHCSAQSFDEGPPATITVRILKLVGRDDLAVSTGTWTETEILNFNKLLTMLCDDLSMISRIVMKEAFRLSLRRA